MTSTTQTDTLNLTMVQTLAQRAVDLRGADHKQDACRYLSVNVTGDSLTYRAECFVGLILWLLVGPERMITGLINEGRRFDTLDGGNAENGSCDTYKFNDILSRLNVEVTPGALKALTFLQRAQDGNLNGMPGHRTWGEALAYLNHSIYILGITDEIPEQAPEV